MAERRVMFVFPGQGSQYRGMGSDICAGFAVARDTYAGASEALGYDIARLSFEDPGNEIGLTRYTQPALLTHEIACLRVFRELAGDAVQPVLSAGHSLGEYTALVAAGSLGLADGLRLVKRRGELMGAHGEGGMLALGLDANAARLIADRHYCQVASINLPEQTVVGGRDADLDALAAEMEQVNPRKRAIRLATEGAFHTYLMGYLARVGNPRCRLAGFAYTTRFEWLLDTIEREGDSLRPQYRERRCIGTGLQMSWLALSSMINWGGAATLPRPIVSH